MKLVFDWDADKAKANLKRHKVSFEEARTVFYDPFLLTFPDPEHSITEERYLNIGVSAQGRILVVIHTERGGTLRIISCRKATNHERNAYEEKKY